MKTTKLATLTSNAQKEVVKRSPQILLGLGIAGMVTSTILAVKATPKAMLLIEEEKHKLNNAALQEDPDNFELIEKLTPAETIKATWEVYVPSAVIAAVSIGCLIGSASVSARRTAALATAYKLSEKALIEYKDAVVETIGEQKEKAVREQVSENRIKANPVNETSIIVTNFGDTLCFDYISGRYFKSDIEKIRKAENELNLVLRNENYISLNSFYDMLGLPTIGVGRYLGWNIDTDGYINIELDAKISENGKPCIVMDFSEEPKYDFDKFL